MKYNVLIGGAAGQGLVKLSHFICKILQRQGYFVFSNMDFMSRIRGGHNFIQIRFGDEPIFAFDPNIDLLLAFNQESLDLHIGDLNESGKVFAAEDIISNDSRFISFPFKEMTKVWGNKYLLTTLFAGSFFKAFDINRDQLLSVVTDLFKDKELIKSNLIAFDKASTMTSVYFDKITPGAKKDILISGNEALALGAIAGGVGFYSAYPMSPSTGIMSYLSKKQDLAKIVVDQTEDEISAIEAALGSSYTGLRSMTASSGGGLALMAESLSFAGVSEIPLVVVDVQRPGPATGLPTHTAQGDLSFALNIAHGEFPKIVMALTDIESSFYDVQRALNLADKFQVPVLILSDQFLGDAKITLSDFDFDRIDIDRCLASNDLLRMDYKRYKITESGVSPRIVPNLYDSLTLIADSHEHDEYGHITENSEVVISQFNKRMRKMDFIAEKIEEPIYMGADSPDILLIGWGSTFSPLKEAVEILNNDLNVGALIFKDIYPLPTERLLHYSKLATCVINVENNYLGQLAKFIRQETGVEMSDSLLKYNGRQINYREIVNFVMGGGK